MAIGLTLRNPASFKELFEVAEFIPKSWSFGYDGVAHLDGLGDDLVEIGWQPKNLRPGSRVGLLVDNGEVSLYQDDEEKFVSPEEVPIDSHLYPFVDLLGGTC